MKILIRDKARGLYLAERDRWVADLNQARDFKSGITALAHLAATGITGVDLFHVFPDRIYNFAVPVRAFNGPPDRFKADKAQLDC
jgi:hypothetical protein